MFSNVCLCVSLLISHFLGSLWACANFNLTTWCYSRIPHSLSRKYGTKTCTRYQKFKIAEDFEQKACQPLMMYLVKRHAIRYPDSKDIISMSEILPKIQRHVSVKKGELCNEDVDAIKEWTLKMRPEDDNLVTESGHQETKLMGYAFAKRFKTLLDPTMAYLEVGVTPKIRTTQTAEAFLEGLKLALISPGHRMNSSYINKWDIPKLEKDFLTFHRTCKRIMKSRQKYYRTSSEVFVKAFRKSEVAGQMKSRIRKRLALKHLSWNTLRTLYRACSFEYAIYESSPWCAVFGEPELQVLEYMEDLEDYVDDAYGNPINAQMSCTLLNDLVSKLNNSVRTKKLSSYLYFTHAGALKRLWAGLGLFRDDDLLKIRNPLEAFCFSSSRNWRLSNSTPFGANLALILYSCRNDRFYIATLVNGAAHKLPFCDSLLCDVGNFIKLIKNLNNDCDLQQICS